MPDAWFHNALLYGLDVETFQDSDGDGVGDFPGLIRRLDYLAELGVGALWLLPFYPSPNRDNGYDVADYRAIDPRLGTLDDFRALVRAAEARGIRVVIDLVVNHTSDQHPWFQEARRDPRSPYRDYYVWADRPGPNANTDLMFPDEEPENWTYDPAAGAYFFHLFYRHQPDLNWANPAVWREVERIVGFWLDQGAAGFRVDAAPHIAAKIDVEHLRRTGLPDEAHARPTELFGWLRDYVAARRRVPFGRGVLLAEADLPADDMKPYLGDRGVHLMFDFLLANYVYLAMARGEAAPLARGLDCLPCRPHPGRLVTFLRNLDELDLERLTDAERAEVFAAFAPEEAMQAYGRGVRRRLAPMLGGDPRRLELAHSLLFGLPGTPLVVYGDEIGMGDDLARPGRAAVRAPMQWSDEPSGGFSIAPRRRLASAPIARGPFAYRRVNAAAQLGDPDSTLERFRRLARARREAPEIGSAPWRVLETGDDAVLALRYDGVLVVHNLAEGGTRARLPVEDAARDLLCGRDVDPRELELAPFGHRWLRLG